MRSKDRQVTWSMSTRIPRETSTRRARVVQKHYRHRNLDTTCMRGAEALSTQKPVRIVLNLSIFYCYMTYIILLQRILSHSVHLSHHRFYIDFFYVACAIFFPLFQRQKKSIHALFFSYFSKDKKINRKLSVYILQHECEDRRTNERTLRRACEKLIELTRNRVVTCVVFVAVVMKRI